MGVNRVVICGVGDLCEGGGGGVGVDQVDEAWRCEELPEDAPGVGVGEAMRKAAREEHDELLMFISSRSASPASFKASSVAER
mmetsp:Transcript_68015/g.145613  ORF Transcript_68015/g.145613 Transcript_68015/m.145613 type:complete len:83 (+) Transcript_68015:219-467(+)